jgi:hypothetical protein
MDSEYYMSARPERKVNVANGNWEYEKWELEFAGKN